MGTRSYGEGFLSLLETLSQQPSTSLTFTICEYVHTSSQIVMGLLFTHLHSNEEYEHALTTASVWHQFSAPSLSRHRPSSQLAVLCSSRPFIPSSFHPSIRPCPVIYNSSGILPLSTPLHQDSINILFGPQLRCTHVRMLCVSEEWFLCLASEAPFGIAAIEAVRVCSALALPAFRWHSRDQVACLAGCRLLVSAVGSPSPLCTCQVSCLSHLLVLV